jgi:hypothetical protein
MSERPRLRDDLHKSTPLGWACRWGRVEMVKLFLACGADPVEADAEPWDTPGPSLKKRIGLKLWSCLVPPDQTLQCSEAGRLAATSTHRISSCGHCRTGFCPVCQPYGSYPLGGLSPRKRPIIVEESPICRDITWSGGPFFISHIIMPAELAPWHRRDGIPQRGPGGG